MEREFEDDVQDYVVAKRRAEGEAKQVKEMRDGLVAVLTHTGVITTDEGGREILLDREVSDGVKSYRRVAIQTRLSRGLDEEAAESMLRERGVYDDCLSAYIDADKVAHLVVEGILTPEEFDRLVTKKVTKALVVT